jgi:hydrogenase nickel incorporation protein HypB
MIARGLRAVGPRPGSVLVIENVGNLVCPALFDLGESARVVISSVTEGADKPAKYPQMFRGADLVLLSKVDLLPYVDFDTQRHAADLKMISPGAAILPISATTGAGLQAWYDWLRQPR